MNAVCPYKHCFVRGLPSGEMDTRRHDFFMLNSELQQKAQPGESGVLGCKLVWNVPAETPINCVSILIVFINVIF